MATIKELFDEGHDVVRRRNWNPYARATLTRLETSTGPAMGPWVKLVDLSDEPGKPFEQQIGIWQLGDDDEYEAWEEKPWPWEEGSEATA